MGCKVYNVIYRIGSPEYYWWRVSFKTQSFALAQVSAHIHRLNGYRTYVRTDEELKDGSFPYTYSPLLPDAQSVFDSGATVAVPGRLNQYVEALV